MADDDRERPAGWRHHPRREIIGPLDYVIDIPASADGPVLKLNMVFTDDGLYVPAIVRTPPGQGPFPIVICLHGGSGGLGLSALLDEVRNRGSVLDRFIAEGFAVCHTEGRM